jgi:PAS domain S-box-containing protein
MVHDHVCLLHENGADHLAALASFHREGLASGYCCVHIGPEADRAALRDALRRGGADPDRGEARGALLLSAPDEVYLSSGDFDPASVVAHLDAVAHEAMKAGLRGLRVSGEMSWALGRPDALERLPAYEAAVDDAVREGRLEAMCCYDRRRFPPDALARIVQSHPTVRFGEEVMRAAGTAPGSRNGDFAERWLAPLLRQLHRSEEAVHGALALKEKLLEVVPAGIYTCDAEGRITSFNPAAARLWGRSPKLGETDARFCGSFRLYHVDGAPIPHDRTPMAAALREGRAWEDTEVVIERPDGSRVTVLVNIAPFRDERGEVTGAINCFVDITDRQQAEEALRASETRFRALTVATADIVFRLTPDWNRIQRLGSRPSEPTDSWVEVFVHPDDRARAAEAIEQAIRSKSPFELEHRTIHEDGRTGWTLSRAVPILHEQGEIREWFGTSKDVSRRKNTEEAEARLQQELSRSLQETRTILGTAPIGIAVAHDPEARVITGNPTLHRLLGVEPGENASKTGPSAARLPFRVFDESGREVPPEELPMQRAAREGIELREVPLVNVFRDGREQHVIVSAAPLLDEEGRSRGAVAAFADVTEQRRTTARLRDADRRKDEFLAMLSHELRNPLATIRTGIELLRMTEDQAAALPSRGRALAALERQAGTLTRLVDDLLDVSRVTTGRVQVRREPVRLDRLVRCISDSARSLFEDRQQELAVSITDEAIWIRGDDTRLEQVIMNLLSNASKYTPEKGQVFLTLAHQDNEAVLRVRDTGVGIALELQPHVFDLFTQGEQPIDRSHSGLGIGLALTRSLVELHGGTVEMASDGPGRGTEFVLRLPAAAPPDAETETEEQTEPGAAAGALRVLVVEDLPDARAMVEHLLQAYGHQVRTVSNGVEALEAVREFEPEVVLLDLGLPGMDGYEVAERIRSDSELIAPVLVAMTGYGQDSDRRRTHAAGFDHHLVKPVDFAGTLRPLLAEIRGRRS